MENDVQFQDISAASVRINGGVVKPACEYSEIFSQATGCKVYLKRETKQYTGSFKERGALNTLLLLTPEQRKAGVIAASAGNHALGLAYHSQRLGIKCTVVMPAGAPLTKISNCRRLGAKVVLFGDHFGQAKEKAMEMGKEEGILFVNGYDDKPIIAGTGTIGLEILQEVPDVDAIIIPVGGGGLLAGIGTAVKYLKPAVRIIGVESNQVPSMTEAMAAGHPITVASGLSLADGLAVPQVGDRAFAICRKVMDSLYLVKESQIALAILRLLEWDKSVVEGAGASGIAALLQHSELFSALDDLNGKTVVIPICGGNIDIPILGRVISQGMAVDRRVLLLQCQISDTPNSLARFVNCVGGAGADIRDILHDRAFSDPKSVLLRVIVEVQDKEHGNRVVKGLTEEGYEVILQESKHIFPPRQMDNTAHSETESKL